MLSVRQIWDRGGNVQIYCVSAGHWTVIARRSNAPSHRSYSEFHRRKKVFKRSRLKTDAQVTRAVAEAQFWLAQEFVENDRR